MKETSTASVRRVLESGKREASVLDNGQVRVMVTDKGGMIPELGAKVENGFLNAHWLPEFRSNSGKKFSEKDDSAFWKVDLLHSLAGNFPCAPSFGGGEDAGIAHPPHGWSANLVWKFGKSGVDEETGAAWAVSSMNSPEKALPLRFRKIDAVFPGSPVHYESLEIINTGTTDADINVAQHNTVGAPFLQAGCRISLSADRFLTPPKGGEFDDTGRLTVGAEFKNLKKAPMRSGKTCDVSLVPGMIGYSDFVTGPVPQKAIIGWSAVSNPVLGLVYLCWFPGPAHAAEDDIVLSFNDLWMQYGGRRFTPWAAYDGGMDRTFCLGTENSIGAYANGLKYSKAKKELLGAPTTIRIPAKGRKVLRYGTLFAPYAGGALDNGLASVQAEKSKLVLSGTSKTVKIAADTAFTKLKGLEKSTR